MSFPSWLFCLPLPLFPSLPKTPLPTHWLRCRVPRTPGPVSPAWSPLLGTPVSTFSFAYSNPIHPSKPPEDSRPPITQLSSKVNQKWLFLAHTALQCWLLQVMGLGPISPLNWRPREGRNHTSRSSAPRAGLAQCLSVGLNPGEQRRRETGLLNAFSRCWPDRRRGWNSHAQLSGLSQLLFGGREEGMNRLERILPVIPLEATGWRAVSPARWVRWGEGWRRMGRHQTACEKCPTQTGLGKRAPKPQIIHYQRSHGRM